MKFRRILFQLKLLYLMSLCRSLTLLNSQRQKKFKSSMKRQPRKLRQWLFKLKKRKTHLPVMFLSIRSLIMGLTSPTHRILLQGSERPQMTLQWLLSSCPKLLTYSKTLSITSSSMQLSARTMLSSINHLHHPVAAHLNCWRQSWCKMIHQSKNPSICSISQNPW